MTLPMPDMVVTPSAAMGGVDGRGQFFLGKRLGKVILQNGKFRGFLLGEIGRLAAVNCSMES